MVYPNIGSLELRNVNGRWPSLVVDDRCDDLYERRIVDRLRAVQRHRLLDFQSVCQRALGVFPSDLTKFMKRISPALTVRAHLRRTQDLANQWSEPHAVDYDWRFSKVTTRYLARFAAQHKKVLCVGTPSVFAELVNNGVSSSLIDANPPIAEWLPQHARSRFVCCDVRSVEKNGFFLSDEFDCAVIDPPWYLDHYNHWLAAILDMLTPDATIFTTVFPPLVRPSAILERRALETSFAKLGVVAYLKRPAIYQTPRFEREVLERHGLYGLNNWRVAPVARIKLGGSKPKWPSPSSDFPRPKWRRYRVADQVVMVTDEGKDPRRPMEPLQCETVDLMTVSQRVLSKMELHVWTSRSRAAVVTDIRVVQDFFEHLERGCTINRAASLASNGASATLVRLAQDLMVGKADQAHG